MCCPWRSYSATPFHCFGLWVTPTHAHGAVRLDIVKGPCDGATRRNTGTSLETLRKGIRTRESRQQATYRVMAGGFPSTKRREPLDVAVVPEPSVRRKTQKQELRSEDSTEEFPKATRAGTSPVDRIHRETMSNPLEPKTPVCRGYTDNEIFGNGAD